MLNKADVIIALQTELNQKLAYQKDTLQAAIISRNSDAKSSAGDKFETSREMVQIEITKIEAEILKTQQFIQHLTTNTAQLVITDRSIFFIAIAFGKLMVSGTEVFCISNSAPISPALVNTKISQQFEFGGVPYKVLDIL
jgi:hypothetical protein